MILKILLLILILLIIALLLYFLASVFVPAVLEQTGSNEHVLLSRFEHKFEKLENRASAKPVTARAFVFLPNPVPELDKKEFAPFKGQSCRTVNEIYAETAASAGMCLGLGDCIVTCPQKAICISGTVAQVSNLCNGCGRCIPSCPRGIIRLVTDDEAKQNKKISWPPKKGFKIWKSCYRMIYKK